MFSRVFRALGADAANRARVVGEYMQRKKEAAYNKHRGLGDIFGVSVQQTIVISFKCCYIFFINCQIYYPGWIQF